MTWNHEAMHLNVQFARALGLPKYCRRAVLTLESNELPRLDIEVLTIGPMLHRDDGPATTDEMVEQVLRIPFVLRLSAVADDTGSGTTTTEGKA